MPAPRVIMLGTAFDTRGGISAVVNTYRAQGLFERWPIEYIATHCDGTPARKLSTAARAMFRLVLSLAKDRRAVLHVHGASRASFWRKALFMSVGLAARCSVIFHLHGGGFAHFYERECGPIRRRLARFFLEHAARVVVLSSQWQAWMASVTDNRNVVCVSNPMLPGDAPATKRRGNTILFLGRLERTKGVFDLVDAVAALRSTVPDVRLVCAGDGDARGVMQFAAERGIADAVTLTGWVGPEQKRELLASASVFALPSHAEGLPVSLLEAMAAGLPVVASNVGGIPDVVTDGINGVLLEPGDTGTLSRLLGRLLGDAALRARLGTAARETVRLRFDARRVIAEIERIYEALGVERRGGPAGRREPWPVREAA